MSNARRRAYGAAGPTVRPHAGLERREREGLDSAPPVDPGTRRAEGTRRVGRMEAFIARLED